MDFKLYTSNLQQKHHQPAHQADATAKIKTTAPRTKTNATTKEDTVRKNYIGMVNGSFKQQYTQHKLLFGNRNYTNHTDRLLNQMVNSHCCTRLQQQSKAM